jgi:glyoxylase-like metal-dependent hydrolase (beta-lactamase superfamily II)
MLTLRNSVADTFLFRCLAKGGLLMSRTPVRSPSIARCCSAFAHVPVGWLRPRPPDRNFLRSLRDAGLPRAEQAVKVRALRQVAQPVPTAMIVEGRRAPRRIRIALTAFVIEHPQARFIVDPGLCIDAEHRALAQLPAVLRVSVSPPRDAVATVHALAELPDASIDFALPTHLHWDHICGVLDLPDLPVHVHETELCWATKGPIAPVGGVRDSLEHRSLTTFSLDGPKIATFERSHDLFGDGSVTLVDLAGHTPGSIGILAHTDTGWVLLAGDAAWNSYQIEDIRQKTSYPGGLADEDRDLCFYTLHRLHAIREQVRIIPTHDHAASQALSGQA